MFDAATLAAAMRPPDDRYHPRSRLVSVEQTTNLAGGHVWPLAQLREVVDVAKANGLRLHMDGARLMNAVVASRHPDHRVDGGLRHRLDRLLEGPRRADGRGAGGLAGADRRGLALQADDGRRAAPGGHRRRRRAVGARPPRRAAGDGPRQRAAAGARAGGHPRRADRSERGRHQHRHLPRAGRARAVHPARGQRRAHGRARRAHGPRGHPPRRRRGGHRVRARRGGP